MLSQACTRQIKSICYHNNFHILSAGDIRGFIYTAEEKCSHQYTSCLAIAKVWPYFSSRRSDTEAHRSCVCVCACRVHVVRQNENVALSAEQQHVLQIWVRLGWKSKKRCMRRKKNRLINRLQHSITNYCQLSSSIARCVILLRHEKASARHSA